MCVGDSECGWLGAKGRWKLTDVNRRHRYVSCQRVKFKILMQMRLYDKMNIFFRILNSSSNSMYNVHVTKSLTVKFLNIRTPKTFVVITLKVVMMN